MTVMGIDFGTTNVRVTTWEPTAAGLPEIKRIGKGDTTTMPAVVAYRRGQGGKVILHAVGEDADALSPDDQTSIQVIRNIKRWALCSDRFVRDFLEWRKETTWPKWWDPESRSVQLWGYQIPAEQVIRDILAEAVKRSGVPVQRMECRTGCPVHSNVTFRSDLVNALPDGSAPGKLTWVTEEPILFLTLAHRAGNVPEGTYLIYDLGGGSFDCALVEVKQQFGQVVVTVYAAAGDPLLGGSDIDRWLATALSLPYPDSARDVRIAKEQVCKDPTSIAALPGGKRVAYSDIEAALKKNSVFEKTIPVMLEVYHHAKLLWKRPNGMPPLGDVIWHDAAGHIRTVWQLHLEDMAQDIDKVLLFGGPTRTPYFKERLGQVFGNNNVVTASDFLPGIAEPELTGAAMGACLTATEKYVPIFVDRIPAKIVLRLSERGGRESSVVYMPFERLPARPPYAPYISAPLALTWGVPATFEVIMEDPDGNLLHSTGKQDARVRSIGGDPLCYANEVKLVLDRFGRVFIDMVTGKDKAEWHYHFQVREDPPWQTNAQRLAVERLFKQERAYEESDQRHLAHMLARNPFGWGEDVG